MSQHIRDANAQIIARMCGVEAKPGTPESDADPRNPNRSSLTLKSQLSHSIAKARKADGDVPGAVAAFLDGMLAGQAAASRARDLYPDPAEWAEAQARAEYHHEEAAWESALGREEGDE